MKPHPRASAAGVDLVKRFEGLRRKAARLNEGGWTIGYGHTRSARQGVEVSESDAEALLIYDLRSVAEALDAWCFSPLNQNQADAIIAFAFNIGLDAFKGSTVLRLLNEGVYLQAAAALEFWRKAEFEGESLVFDALVRRRAAEKALFLTPIDGYRPTPSPVLRPRFDPSVIEVADQRRAAVAGAVTATASLDGETAELAVDRPPTVAAAEPVTSPVQAAAAKVTERLNRLFVDDPPVIPISRPILDQEDEAVPQAEAPQPFSEGPDPVGTLLDVESPPPPPPRERPPYLSLAPDLFDEPPEALEFGATPEDEEPLADTSNVFTGPYGRRQREARPITPVASGGYPPGVLVLGLMGAAMVLGSLLAMLGGRATLTNLAIGLVGVVLLAPISARFITARLERGDSK